MCGIAGIWRFNISLNKDELKSFTDSMRHRGPDGAGYEVFEKDGLGLGHRRLSILDLTSAGKQPMTYADSRYWLTFNGEIYNFLEIRKELKSKGHAFISDTDSEVILAAFTQWGTNCFKKFNGMWAIAIWDNIEKQLLLCRDRFGVKPLHYSYIQNTFFAFASETIAFKHLSNYKRSYNTGHLVTAMNAHNVLEPAGLTIYENIYQVLPGSYLVIKKNETPKEFKWWNTLDNLPKVPSSFNDQKNEFFSLFADACRLRLRSDVPVASALSGGIDSTAVFCMIHQVMKSNAATVDRVHEDWQKAFSIAFPGSAVDERKYIESVLEQTKGKGIITEARNDNIVNELEYSSVMSDFISGTPLACLTYVYKSMHQNGIVVSMDGHGADEYLYGYNTSVAKALLQAYVSGNKEYAEQVEDTFVNMNFNDKGNTLIASIKKQADRIVQNNRGLKSKSRKILRAIFPKQNSGYHLPAFEKGRFFTASVPASGIFANVENYYLKNTNAGEQQLLEEFHYTDLPYNLRDFDRGAMQHQVEIRMPFMDYRLVTYTMALPQSSKLNHGYTKYILRESMKGVMPENIRTRKLKIGLGAPLPDWFNGPLNTFLQDIVHSAKLGQSAFLNSEIIKETVSKNCRDKNWNDHNSAQLWPVINYLLLNEN